MDQYLNIQAWVANALSPAAGKSTAQQVFDWGVTSILLGVILSLIGAAAWWVLRPAKPKGIS